MRPRQLTVHPLLPTAACCKTPAGGTGKPGAGPARPSGKRKEPRKGRTCRHQNGPAQTTITEEKRGQTEDGRNAGGGKDSMGVEKTSKGESGWGRPGWVRGD